jgi:hypothetical protein
MKKLTLLLVTAAMISGSAYAQEKDCCKKNGGKCPKTEACSKNMKNCSKDCKDAKKETAKK